MGLYKKALWASVLAAMLFVAPSAAGVVFEQSKACVTAKETGNVYELNVALAQTNEQRAFGLMQRTELAKDFGMVFIYDRPAVRGFWMFRTLVPLDIAFINNKGVVLETQSMQPCESKYAYKCPVYSPHSPYVMALEMAAGRFKAIGLLPGSSFKLSACET